MMWPEFLHKNKPIKQATTKSQNNILDWIGIQGPSLCCVQETHLVIVDSQHCRDIRRKSILIKRCKRQADIAILMSDKINFKSKQIIRDREKHYIVIKGKIHQDDTQF